MSFDYSTVSPSILLAVRDELTKLTATPASKGPVKKKEHRMTINAKDPLAALKEIRMKLSKDEAGDLGDALDAQIAALESSVATERQEYAKQLNDLATQANASKQEIDTLRTVLDAQKQEFANISAILEQEK